MIFEKNKVTLEDCSTNHFLCSVKILLLQINKVILNCVIIYYKINEMYVHVYCWEFWGLIVQPRYFSLGWWELFSTCLCNSLLCQTQVFVLSMSGELIFFVAAHLVLCFRQVNKRVLITHQCLGYCWIGLAQHQRLLCFSLCLLSK